MLWNPQQMCTNNIIFFLQYETFYKILQNKSLHVGHLAIYALKHIKWHHFWQKKSIKNTYLNNFKRWNLIKIYTLKISNCNISSNSYGEAFLLEKCEIVISYFNIEANNFIKIDLIAPTVT